MPEMNVRLIAMDMDGTLLDADSRITPGVLAALREAQAHGILVSICTGRFPENAGMVLKEYGFVCPVIGVNGALIMDAPIGGRVLAQHLMDESVAWRVFDTLEESQAGYYVFGLRHVSTREPGAVHHSQREFGERIEREADVTFDSGASAVRAGIASGCYKFFVYEPGLAGTLPALRDRLAAISGATLTQSSPRNIEIMPLGVDKGSGVRELAALHGIPMENVMTMGDEENDLPMIACAGYGVAMGNATEKVKAAARIVTADNRHDGVAAAIRGWAL